MNTRLDDIKSKIAILKKKDQSFKVFGSSKHQYMFNHPKSEEALQAFEQKFNIRLPEEYRSFLKQIGNGGAGPFYGLEKLEYTYFQDLDFVSADFVIDPSSEFKLTEAWNMDLGDCDDENYKVREKEYFDPKWVSGLLRIANYGCGVSINIVVNGSEYGSIWFDDRCNDHGIYPDENPGIADRIGFFDWYEYWLDTAILKGTE